jgi:predicted transcriptional regulator
MGAARGSAPPTRTLERILPLERTMSERYATTAVKNPQGKGYVAERFDYSTRRVRISREVYPSRDVLNLAVRLGRISWGDWQSADSMIPAG